MLVRHRTLMKVAVAVIMLLFCVQAGNTQSFEASLAKDLKWRGTGPANMSGRITDIQALDDDYRYALIASASGGVWKSVNAGTTWEPIFDTYGSASIGSVAIFQKNPDIIWVGTGEANVRNSVGWGDGIYKSTDGGKTFTNVGLRDSHHVPRITLHPTNPDIAYVASQGHLWGYTGERGLYKTTNGGKSWQKLAGGLPDDGKTGCTDIRMDPKNPDILYCAFWERIRRPYRFDSGGPNGGIFKSTDGGKTWKKLTNGLPKGDIGRIGLSIYMKDPRIIMAIVEHGFQPRPNDPDYKDMSKLGTGVYRSEDGGETWKYVNRYNNRPFYYSQIFINPSDDQRVYAMGGTAQVSTDGGKTFRQGMPGIAGDFHWMWIDPHNKDRYYVGDDKGVSITHDHGEHFNFFNNYAISQIYAVSADMRDPYYVYVGLQDNGIWGGPSNSRDFNGILNDHWFKFHSGDGFHSAVDPTDWTTVYSESQGGAIRRNHALFRQQTTSIRPSKNNTTNWEEMVAEQTDPDRPTIRMNWSTPFILSPHNPRTLYYGANHLFKSVNRGDTWTIISPDLSTNDPVKTNRESGGITRDVTAAETHCTIITLSESVLKPGLIWAGTDDGNVHFTTDDGKTWTNVRTNFRGVPDGIWVSRVEASHFDEGTCYVTFDGHRSDIFTPFVFKTTDYGKSWANITGNLPDGQSVYVIREDIKNKNLLFLGTEFAAYFSIDGGTTWTRLMHDMPTVAVHDLLIHPRDNDLIAGTHGRGTYILDDITPLQQLTDDVKNTDAYLFENPVATKWKGISRGATMGHQLYIGKNPLSMSQIPPSNSPSEIRNTATINYYLRNEPRSKLVLEISNLTGTLIRKISLEGEAGINRYRWNMLFDAKEEKKLEIIAQMEEIYNAEKKRLEKDAQKLIDNFFNEMHKADTPAKFERIRRQLMREARNFNISGFYGIDSWRGTEAAPGTYLVKLTVDGKILNGSVTIREDPLFKK